ncbi:DUF427 domain-containing protein [uncultured Jatrophihabitans sp.]|uniref:DUF427 domain-containing protein n=1 Tax=uncultured Jatrophihabitans sp. TaxID=1610747 RepID=UPI0035CBA8B3
MSEHPSSGFPAAAVAKGHVEPAPRRVRGYRAGRVVFDTVRARYVWEWPFYPQYYIPSQDVVADHGLGPEAVRVFDDPADEQLRGLVRFRWDALDAWFEEDEQIVVHPRNPYTRIDALRSHRQVRVELDGVLLAETGSPVLLFETGLPTRYYLDRTDIAFEHLMASETQTQCPYKGTTSGYWSIRTGTGVHPDLAWTYDHPTREATAIQGMVAFYNEKVDITVDGVQLERPATHFS